MKMTCRAAPRRPRAQCVSATIYRPGHFSSYVLLHKAKGKGYQPRLQERKVIQSGTKEPDARPSNILLILASRDWPVLGVVTPTAVGKGGSKPTNVQVCKPREQAQLILSVVALGNTLEV